MNRQCTPRCLQVRAHPGAQRRRLLPLCARQRRAQGALRSGERRRPPASALGAARDIGPCHVKPTAGLHTWLARLHVPNAGSLPPPCRRSWRRCRTGERRRYPCSPCRRAAARLPVRACGSPVAPELAQAEHQRSYVGRQAAPSCNLEPAGGAGLTASPPPRLPRPCPLLAGLQHSGAAGAARGVRAAWDALQHQASEGPTGRLLGHAWLAGRAPVTECSWAALPGAPPADHRPEACSPAPLLPGPSATGT